MHFAPAVNVPTHWLLVVSEHIISHVSFWQQPEGSYVDDDGLGDELVVAYENPEYCPRELIFNPMAADAAATKNKVDTASPTVVDEVFVLMATPRVLGFCGDGIIRSINFYRNYIIP